MLSGDAPQFLSSTPFVMKRKQRSRSGEHVTTTKRTIRSVIIRVRSRPPTTAYCTATYAVYTRNTLFLQDIPTVLLLNSDYNITEFRIRNILLHGLQTQLQTCVTLGVGTIAKLVVKVYHFVPLVTTKNML